MGDQFGVKTARIMLKRKHKTRNKNTAFSLFLLKISTGGNGPPKNNNNITFTEFHQTCLENTGQAFGATLMLVKLRMTLPGNF